MVIAPCNYLIVIEKTTIKQSISKKLSHSFEPELRIVCCCSNKETGGSKIKIMGN